MVLLFYVPTKNKQIFNLLQSLPISGNVKKVFYFNHYRVCEMVSYSIFVFISLMTTVTVSIFMCLLVISISTFMNVRGRFLSSYKISLGKTNFSISKTFTQMCKHSYFRVVKIDTLIVSINAFEIH